MKACCVILIPRHVTVLLFIVCSCHMLVLLNWASVNNQHHAPLQHQNYFQAKPLISAEIGQKQPLQGVARDFPASLTRWNLSSVVDDRALPGEGGRIDGYIIRRQLNSDLLEAHKANGGSFSNVGTNRLGAHSQLYQILTSKASVVVTQQKQQEGETKKMRPLIYSDRRLKEFYRQNNTAAKNTNDYQSRNRGILFRYILNPEFICQRSEDSPNGAYLTVMVHSHPRNKPQRDAIRNTWGRLARNYDTLYQMRLVFVLGIATPSEIERQDLIRKESRLYRDIIQGYFTDSYENLSVKSLFAIHWVSHFCHSAKYMLKTDDDTYINVSALIKWLLTNGRSHTVIGAVNHEAEVMRSGLWKVPFELFPFNRYPAYCTGCAYVLSTSILKDLLSKSETVPLIPVEDAYITGILVTLIGHTCYNHKQFPQWYMGPSMGRLCKIVKQTLFGVHNVPYYSMYDIYNNITMNSLETCGRTNNRINNNNNRIYVRKHDIS